MALNKKRQIRMEQRRRLVSELLLRRPGITQREICDDLEERGFVNPDTGKPYSLGTVNSDVQTLEDGWRRSAQRDIAEFKWRQIAELDEVKRAAWSDKDVNAVMRAIKLQMDITGTEAPKRSELQVATWRDKLIDALRAGRVEPEQVQKRLGDKLAAELFQEAGVDAGS